MTGTKTDRPELTRLKEVLRSGDVVVIESLSRLGRSTKDLLALMDQWDKQGVKVISLKEQIDTQTPTGKLLLTVLSAISQFERDITVQRTREGLEAARARGCCGGRPKADKEKVFHAVMLYQANCYSVKEICELSGVSASTLYRELRKKDLQKRK